MHKNHLESLLKQKFLDSTSRDFLTSSSWAGLAICVSNELPADADVAGLRSWSKDLDGTRGFMLHEINQSEKANTI